MRYLALIAALLGSPAYAHHEIVVATTMMPLMGGIAAIIFAAITAIGLRLKERRLKREQNPFKLSQMHRSVPKSDAATFCRFPRKSCNAGAARQECT